MSYCWQYQSLFSSRWWTSEGRDFTVHYASTTIKSLTCTSCPHHWPLVMPRVKIILRYLRIPGASHSNCSQASWSLHIGETPITVIQIYNANIEHPTHSEFYLHQFPRVICNLAEHRKFNWTPLYFSVWGHSLATTILNFRSLDLQKNGIWNNLILRSYTTLCLAIPTPMINRVICLEGMLAMLWEDCLKK